MLINEIKKDLDEARKNKKSYVPFLASVYADVLMFGKNNGNRETTDTEAVKILKNFQSKTEEVISLLKQKNADCSEYEKKITLIRKYIPKQMNESELESVIARYVSELEVKDKKAIGIIMKKLQSEHAGCYDGKTASAIIRRML